MLSTILQTVSNELDAIRAMLMLLNALLHLIFAGAVAKDAGLRAKHGDSLFLVSPLTWGFATLIGGVFTAALYWFMHHWRR